MATELPPDVMREAYAAYCNADPEPEWFATYREAVRHFRALSDSELATPAEQENLWRARGISTLGPGEAVSTTGAYDDPEIVDLLVGLRSRRWPEEPGKRARAVQDAYDRVLDLVHPTHSKTRPQAKLGRAFAALLPADLTTCFTWKSSRHATRLVLGSRKVQSYEGAVLVRARLRGLLGEEADLDEHIRRSMFCWWLHENHDRLVVGEIPRHGASEADEDDRISIWTPTKQRMGLTSVGGYVDTYRSMVGATRGGASPDDAITTFRVGSDLAESSSRAVFNDVRWLGFLEHEGGLWSPSEAGEQLLEEDPAEVLVHRMLERVFGMAWSLRLLANTPTTPKALGVELRAIYPNWTSDVMPNNLVGWLEALGLLERTSGPTRTLTDYGQAWHNRLPKDLPRPAIAPPDLTPETHEAEVDNAPAWPSLQQMLEAFRTDGELAGFVFDESQIRALHLAWHAHDLKRFVILSGLSGTGKTALLCHYARIYSGLLGCSDEAHRQLVPVSPDWRDPSGLLGYLNALHADPTFQAEPALRVVLAAHRNPQLPYFLILDEMNLARVERYFAPFLSAMETGDDLVLHAHDEPLNRVPPVIGWPRNLFIGGTVNMDETTHPFSDKVLDRAFTLEFFDVDLPSLFDRRAAQKGHRDATVEGVLLAFNDTLRPLRRHFGYRTASEVLEFLDAATDQGVTDATSRRHLLDQAVFSKVLPRLRGEQTPPLEAALTALLALCRSEGLARCEAKLRVMQERLRATGITRFWS